MLYACRFRLSLVLATVLLAASSPAAQAGGPHRPFPQHVTYAAGTIRPDHRSQARQDQDVRDLYDAWKSRWLASAGFEADGHPRFRVRHQPDGTVSEGQGYGMLLAVLMAGYDPAARVVFDGLWEFRLDHPSRFDPRLMDWYVPDDEGGDGRGDDCAFDGDADMAYALLLAARQWGRNGRFDYLEEARRTIAGLHDSARGPRSQLPMLGDWVPRVGWPYNQYSVRTSDFMVGHFHDFARATGDPDWDDTLDAVLAVVAQVQADHAPATGLLPDFLVPVPVRGIPLEPAPPFFLEGPFDGAYEYNACRDPWRLGTHALTTGDPRSLAAVRKMADWVVAATGGDPSAIHAGYALDGAPLPGSNYSSAAFVAPFLVGAMCDPALQGFVNDAYEAVRNTDQGYYEDSLALLCLVVASGNWWTP